MLYPKTIQKADENITEAKVTSRNEFIEKAINFYIGYLNSQENIDFINEIITQTLEAQINKLEENISSLLFKQTVELNMMMNILGLHFDINKETLDKLRNQSIKQVQETIGKVNLTDVFKEYREKE